MNIRKHLSATALFKKVRQAFSKVTDKRVGNTTIFLVDALMSAFAMFSLKDDSLLSFDDRRENETELNNLKSVYKIEHVPSDTTIREILDPIDPEELRPLFKNLFNQLQRDKILDKFKYMGKYYILSADGTSYFSSKKIHCDSCLKRTCSKSGKITYSHQLYGASIVHPSLKEVIPLMPEQIIKQDGQSKNDCERNASKRYFNKFRQDHPRLSVIVVEDALSSNGPHIRELQRHNLRYILGAKKSDHKFLFEKVEEARQSGLVKRVEIEEKEIVHRFDFINKMPLNGSNQDLSVNFLEYWQISNEETLHFTWVTDFKITEHNVYDLMRAGRARWKIENENFNTLKNQGYNLEHNYGHGKINLSVNFAILMILAFLIEQIQQLACPLFNATWQKERSKKRMWEHLRSIFFVLNVNSMEQIYEALFYGFKVSGFIINYDTS